MLGPDRGRAGTTRAGPGARGGRGLHDLDRLHVLVSVAELGIIGYQAADWLRANRHNDVGLSDHERILATLSMADNDQTGQRLVSALEASSEG